MSTLESLHATRLERWRQTPQARIAGADEAAALIEQLGLVTLYPASPEVANLYSAFVGDPDSVPASEWDSPAGVAYGWRWDLGRREAAFYTALVRRRPTWVRWELLPAVLRLCGDLRTPDELADLGVISQEAYRIARVLEEAGGTLSTGELRKAAGFPTGKEHRAAYLKAVEELDTRLLLAKVFAAGDEDMRHALVATRYPKHVAAAERLTQEQALEHVLLAYLPHAVYALPTPFARHLKLPEAELRAGLDRLERQGRAEATTFEGRKGACYVWVG
jgi:hypothetical protein